VFDEKWIAYTVSTQLSLKLVQLNLKSFLPKSLYGIRWDLSWARKFFAHVFGAFLLILDATVDEALGDVYRRQKFGLSVAFQLTLFV
jgi:hypothetical protein